MLLFGIKCKSHILNLEEKEVYAFAFPVQSVKIIKDIPTN